MYRELRYSVWSHSDMSVITQAAQKYANINYYPPPFVKCS